MARNRYRSSERFSFGFHDPRGLFSVTHLTTRRRAPRLELNEDALMEAVIEIRRARQQNFNRGETGRFRWLDNGTYVDRSHPRHRPKMSEPEKRARRTLRRHLTPTERKRLRTKNKIRVKGGVSGHTYEIDCHKASHNITELKTGDIYCSMLGPYWGASFPIADHVLAQMLALKYNEKKLLRVANRVWRGEWA